MTCLFFVWVEFSLSYTSADMTINRHIVNRLMLRLWSYGLMVLRLFVNILKMVRILTKTSMLRFEKCGMCAALRLPDRTLSAENDGTTFGMSKT